MRKVMYIAAMAVALLRAQTDFEVASVKASVPPQAGTPMRQVCTGGPGTNDPGFWRCTNMSLFNLLQMAYDLRLYQLTAEEWTQHSRFDITARFPEGATKEQARPMEQNLLTERFKLAMHRERKEMPAYQLTVAKGGPRLKDAPAVLPPFAASARGNSGVDAYGCPEEPEGWRGVLATRDRRLLGAIRGSIEEIAATLSGFLGTPVLNATGLPGPYQYRLCFAPDPAAPDADPGPTLVQALREQLGLTLESKKGLIEVVVIDHAERTPVEN
jgi:uncharacterized protein (TIGR03435 family)